MYDDIEVGSEILSAIAHPNRIRILKKLRNGRVCNCKLLEWLDIEQPNLSRHLKGLVHAGILNRTKEGVKVFYEIIDPRVMQLIHLAERIAADALMKKAKMVDDMIKADVDLAEKSVLSIFPGKNINS